MKNKKLILAINILIIISLIMVNTVSAIWIDEGSSGNWNTYPYEVPSGYFGFASYGNNEGRWNASRSESPINFASLNYSIRYTITLNITGVREQWYWWNGVKAFYNSIELRSETTGESVFSLFYIAHEQGIAIETSEAKVGASGFEFIPKVMTGLAVETKNATWIFQMSKLDDTHVGVAYGQVATYDAEAFLAYNGLPYAEFITSQIIVHYENYTVSSGFFDEVSIYGYAGHSGSGNLEILYSDLSIGVTNLLGNNIELSESFVNPFQWIIDIGAVLFLILTLVVTVIMAIVPFLPILVIFYFIDVCMTSLQQKSFQPIGIAFMTVLNIGIAVFTTVISFGEFLWDIITFWN